MNDLQMSLIATGMVILLIVIAYNAWQSRKIKQRMTSHMPLEKANITTKTDLLGDKQNQIFIKPTHLETHHHSERREPTMGGHQNVNPGIEKSIDLSRSQEEVNNWDGRGNQETYFTTPFNQEETARDNPNVQNIINSPVSNYDTKKNLQEEMSYVDDNERIHSMTGSINIDADRQKDGVMNLEWISNDYKSSTSSRYDGMLPSAARSVFDTIAAFSIVDQKIDCIVSFPLSKPFSGQCILPLRERIGRASTKPIYIEGRIDKSRPWRSICADDHYIELRIAVQLANRGGAMNEREFYEFTNGVQLIADVVGILPEFPEMKETLAKARELDSFAAQCDAQLSINILSNSAPWSANYIQAMAMQDGMLLSRNGMRFVKLDAKQTPIFMLQFASTNFLRDDLTYKDGDLITLLLDVPMADQALMPFDLMCVYAKSIAQRIDGFLVDDLRHTLTDAALQNINHKLLMLYKRLEESGLPAGSQVARRLFSQ
ncbi:cell division protein ZipA C-terminal FtsZ-binding domain-containing protein [Candidatus Pandoraea novymonadis]|uniref:Cell division protein ZipA n=1 Tax=Candidatus Pandoraea novymonadis TaxID=1808959 RepID=A0ABX5FEH6_9BURK|nr:cell division protein ZipA C-terminal FtsZ-binding domain-containing protein [Candidatus Pandoraea novymonadis]PSB92039.1 Cell division protein ZipA [Candidatus Pandoraea novymonadis]